MTATPAPGRRTLGPLLLVAAAALLVGAVAGGLLAGSGSGSAAGPDAPTEGSTPEPGSIEAVAAELAEGQQAQAAELAEELAGAAETAHDEVGEVLVGLAAVAPPDGAADAEGAGGGDGGALVDAAALGGHLQQARSALEATGEGADDHGVTRAALLGAVDLLTGAVETAAALPGAGAGAPEAEASIERVARDRDAAVRLWQAGATRLDTLVVATGGEHVHLFLAPDGDPDAVPEEFRDTHADE